VPPKKQQTGADQAAGGSAHKRTRTLEPGFRINPRPSLTIDTGGDTAPGTAAPPNTAK
jgi:hypothetical protein